MTPNPLRSSALAPPSPAHAAAYGPADLEPGSTEGWAGDAWAPPRRRPLRAVIATARPRQWIKNGLVVAAAGAAGALGHDDVPVRVTVACLAFCLLASGIYAINDVRDVHEDRLHPRKRFRPVAAGELGESQAVLLGMGFVLTGLAMCVAIRPLLGLVGAAYLAITLSYTLVWRHVLILDLLAISGGFVLRAVAGGVAAPVELSRWFILVVSAAAVFVAAAKRYAELQRVTSVEGPRRRVLDGYTPALLESILLASAAVAIIAYCAWAFAMPTVRGVPWRLVTILPFSLCLARYGMLVRAGSGEAPEDVLLSDRLLQFAGVCWLAIFALSVHAAA